MEKIKYKLILPVFKILEKIIGKYLIKTQEDIPDEWYNAHLKMFFHSWEKGLEDLWKHYTFSQQQNKVMDALRRNRGITLTREEDLQVKLKEQKKCWSGKGRMFIIQVWLTEMMADRADREWSNFAILNLTHEVMKHYGVTEKQRSKVPKAGEFPVNRGQFTFDYFENKTNMKKWERN